jgi:hypothetical protein
MSQHRGIFHHLPGDRPRLGGARNSPTQLPRLVQKEPTMAKKTEDVEDTQPPTPHVTREPFTETHMEAHPVTGEQVPMAGPARPVVEGPRPVAIGIRRFRGAPGLASPMVANRATHAYFRRTAQVLRALGKSRR